MVNTDATPPPRKSATKAAAKSVRKSVTKAPAKSVAKAVTKDVARPSAGSGTQPAALVGARNSGTEMTRSTVVHSPVSHPAGRAAAARVQHKEHINLSLPVIGRISLPHPQDMAFYAGVAALVALEMLEWPAGVALAVGHALTSQRHNRVLEEFGEALEEA